MPRNLAKIYKDYILPVFEDNIINIKNITDNKTNGSVIFKNSKMLILK